MTDGHTHTAYVGERIAAFTYSLPCLPVARITVWLFVHSFLRWLASCKAGGSKRASVQERLRKGDGDGGVGVASRAKSAEHLVTRYDLNAGCSTHTAYSNRPHVANINLLFTLSGKITILLIENAREVKC